MSYSNLPTTQPSWDLLLATRKLPIERRLRDWLNGAQTMTWSLILRQQKKMIIGFRNSKKSHCTGIRTCPVSEISERIYLRTWPGMGTRQVKNGKPSSAFSETCQTPPGTSEKLLALHSWVSWCKAAQCVIPAAVRRKDLQRVLKAAQRIIGTSLLHLKDAHSNHLLRHARTSVEIPHTLDSSCFLSSPQAGLGSSRPGQRLKKQLFPQSCWTLTQLPYMHIKYANQLGQVDHWYGL